MGLADGLGCTLIGGLVSAMLYGITTLQAYLYYMHYSAEDASIIKLVVATIWILDTLHVSFTCHILYYFLVTNYGVPTSLKYIIWTFPASFLVNLLETSVVRFFFSRQIYYLCRRQLRWLVTAPIVLSILVHFGFEMGMVLLMSVKEEISIITQFRFYAAIPCGATGVLSELLITVSLCVLLYDGSSGSAFPRTKRLLNSLIVYAVNRCLLILIVTIAEVAVTVDNQNSWAMGLSFITGRLGANSLLASLNTREYLQSGGSGPESDTCINAIHFANLPKLSGDTESSKDGVIDISGRV